MAGAGAHTILAARSTEALEREASRIRDEGGAASIQQLDLAEARSIENCASAVKPDILVNVSGMNLRKRFETYTREEYDRMLETNLHGVVRLTQLVGAGMVERGTGGKIVFTGSLMSLLGLPYLTVYAMSKARWPG